MVDRILETFLNFGDGYEQLRKTVLSLSVGLESCCFLAKIGFFFS